MKLATRIRSLRRRPRRPRRGARKAALLLESLEPRLMLAGDPTDIISVGRTLSAWSTQDVQNDILDVTYTVYNQQAAAVADVLLNTTLEAGVGFESASLIPDFQSGQEIEWNFGTLEPFESASVSVTVSLDASNSLKLDVGAFALGTFDAIVVDDVANPAVLRTDTIAPAQLAATPDANPNDPFIQAKAAELNQDAIEIFEFVRDDIGFESYLGSLRGSRGTLWSDAGNSLDQASLMIALLRASGVEAQYAQGTLTDQLAQDLIESMFPDQTHVVGMIEPGEQVADPINDAGLIAEAKPHFWVEFDNGVSSFSADPSFAGAALDQTFAPVDVTFTETAEALRHHVTVRLDRELTLPAAGLFSGGSSQFVETALEATFSTAELVGRHLSVGHFVNRDVKSFLSTLITHTYSPYLLIGETDRDITDDELIRGEDFQEQITDFPLGSQLLTGLFLEIDVADTEGAVETFQRTIVDRIGIDIRQNGGSLDINIDETTPPAVTDVDIVTISVLPGLQFPGAVASQADRVADPQTALNALPTDGIPDQAPFTTEQSAVLAEALQLMRLVVIGVNETKASAYAASSDESLRQLQLGYLTKAYYDSPRIILSETSTADGTLGTSLDLRKNDVRTIAFPGQLAGIPLMFEIMRGMMDSTIEGEVVSGITGQQAISIDTVFAATGAGNELVTITTDNLIELQGLALSEAAKIRISQAVLNGKGVTTPSAMVTIDGRETVGWLETDLITGETISVFEDGGHLAIAEYAAIINHVLTSPLNLAVTAFIGGVQGYGLSQLQFAGEFIGDLFALGSVEKAAKSAKAKVAKNLIEEYGKQVLGLAKTQVTSYVNGVLGAPDKTTKCFAGILAGGGIANVSVISIGKCVENEIKTFFKGKTGLSALEKSYKAGVLVGMAAGLAFLTYNFPGDPPVFPYLSVPLGDLPAPITPNAVPGVNVSVEREPLFFYPYNGVQLPSVFNTIIQNTGPQPDTFALSVSGLPAGFEALSSLPQVTLQPGHTGLIGLTIRPSDLSAPLPPPGTQIPFTVTATSTSAGAVSASAPDSFTLGEIHAIRLIAEQPLLVTSPGTPVTTSFSIASVGNVPESVAFSIDLSAGIAATAIAPVNLNLGDVVARSITFTPDPGTPLDSAFVATIVADLGSSLIDEVAFTIEVAAPGVRPAQAASVAAADLGLDDLASRLDDLANLLTQIVQDPGDPIVKEQAVINLTSVINQTAEEPILAEALDLSQGIFPPIFDALGDLESAATVQECLDAINAIGTALTDFADAIQALARHDVSLVLLPNAIVAQPQVPQDFRVIMQNVGTQTTTYDLTVSGVPAGVTSQLSDTQVTLAPNESFVATLTLTQTDDEELLAFPFSVDVTASGVTPEVTRSAAGSLQVRREIVSIPNVTADPPFVDPGEAVNVSARILNSVNRQQDVLVSFTVRDPSDQVVFTSDSVQTQLTVQTTFDDVDLGPLDTTGFGLGQHIIEVTVTDIDANAIPGALGQGSLLLGPPVSASLTVDPQVFLAGTRTTSNTFEIRAEAQIGDPFSIVAQLPLSEFSNDLLRGLAVNGEALYVFGGQVVHVVDITEPRMPEHLERAGHPAFRGIVDGDRLIVTNTVDGATPFASNSTLHYYDIGGNFGPTNPLDLLPPVDSVNFNYNFAGKPVVTGDTVFVSVGKIRFFTANNDVFAQPGTVVSFDISNPLDIQVSDFLFNTNGQNIDPPTNIDGGDFFIFDVELPEPNTLYAATTTATGTETELDEFGQPAVGRILVVDVSDPTNINSDPPNDSKIITELQIPGTTLVQMITIQDDIAYVVGTEGGWLDFFADVSHIGPTGNIVLATVDISNPTSPSLIHSEVINRAGRGAGELVPIGDGRFVMFSFGATTDTPQFLVIDASNPAEFIIESQFDAPGLVEGFGSDGDFLYATGAFGLVIYQVDGGGDIPVTAQVQIPNNTGVEVVAGSFNTPPDSVISGTDFDTLQWDILLDENNLFPTFTWDTQVTDLQGGEAREVTLDTNIDFTFQSIDDQITLPPEAVIGQHFLSMDPPSRTARPGEAVVYNVTFKNLNDIPSNPFFVPPPITYDISVTGIPDSWHIFPDSFLIGGKSTTFQFRVEADPLTPLGDYALTITATNDGVSDSVQGLLTLEGDVFTPFAEERGVSGSIQPTLLSVGQGNAAVYDIELINTGVSEETLTFEVDTFDLPPGTTVAFSEDTVVIPPGPGNRRELTLTVIPPVGSTPDQYFLIVFAQSADFELFVDLSAELVVLEQGVEVAITPTTGSPASTFDLIVTNTGEVTDTFDLSISAPSAIVSTLGSTFVTLDAGDSQTIPITVADISFALPGLLPLVATATSQAQPGVTDSDAADVEIDESRNLFAEFDPNVVALPTPGPSTLRLIVNNLGNVEDQYVATIIGTTGPIIASLNGLNDPVTTSEPFIIPPLGSAVLLVNAELTDAEPSTVTVEVVSVNDPSMTSEATATLLVTAFDFGDAPDGIELGGVLRQYPTLFENDGARHEIVEGGPFLGTIAGDNETDGQSDADATGDDASNTDDEDVDGTEAIVLSRGQSLTGIEIEHDGAEEGAFLNGWIDLNIDGDWDDTGEQFLNIAVPAGASSTALDSVTLPVDATVGTSFIRLRISTTEGLTPRGAAPDGEVEDIRIVITSDDGGVLNKTSTDNTINLVVLGHEADLNVPGVGASVLDGVDLTDQQAIIDALVGSGVDVSTIVIDVNRRDDGQTSVTETETYITSDPGTVFTGDPENDPCNVIVLQGQLNIDIINTTTITQSFTDVLTITGQLVADLSLTKSVNDQTPEIGDSITFTIEVSNAGPAVATGVAVTDLLPAGIALVSSTQTQGTYDDGSGIWDVGSLPANSVATLTITAQVTTGDPLTNVAQVTASDRSDPDSTPGNNISSEDDHDFVGIGQCLTGGPLNIMSNRLIFSCATPSSFSAFVVGSDLGSSYFAEYDVTAGIADAEVLAIGIADSNGTAVVHVTIPDELVEQPLYFQAFEINPLRTLSNMLELQAATAPLRASGGIGPGANPLDEDSLSDLVDAAISRWETFDLAEDVRQELRNSRFAVSDLPGDVIGAVAGDTILIDPTAAGHGWFVDPTPNDDAEYDVAGDGSESTTTDTALAGRLDLLTAVFHELGHRIGLSDNAEVGQLMNAELPTATRRTPTTDILPAAEDPLVTLARELDEQHDFQQPTNDYRNWGGRDERWLQDAAGTWYFIVPDGQLYAWDGGSGATGTLIGEFDATFHQDLSLLYAPPAAANNGHGSGGQASAAVALDQQLDLYTSGDLYLNWGGLNEKWLQSRANGGSWYYITPDGEFYEWLGGATTNATLLASLDTRYYTDPAELYNASETAAANSGGNGGGTTSPAEAIDVDLGLHTNGDLYLNWGGLNEKWLQGRNDEWYFILPDGRFYAWHGGSIANSTLLHTIDAIYYSDPALLYDAA